MRPARSPPSRPPSRRCSPAAPTTIPRTPSPPWPRSRRRSRGSRSTTLRSWRRASSNAARSSSATARYALAGAGDVLSDAHEALAARVGERLAAARFAPPTLASLEEELGAQRRDLNVVLEVLTRRGAAVRVDRDLWFDRAAVDEARERLDRGARAPLPRSPSPSIATCSAPAAATPRHCSSSSTARASPAAAATPACCARTGRPPGPPAQLARTKGGGESHRPNGS